MQIDVWQGDITRCPGVEAVVNAANEALAAGGGVCGAIFRAAGAEALTAACRAVPPPVPTGSAASTEAGALSARGIRRIIHAVGPVWRDGEHEEAALLASAYRSALTVAVADGVRSVAFPMISAGIFGFPPQDAARVAVQTIKHFDGPVDTVVLVAYDGEAARTWEAALSE